MLPNILSAKISAEPRIKSVVRPGYAGVWGLREGANTIPIETIDNNSKPESFNVKVIVKMPDSLKGIHITGGPGKSLVFNHNTHVVVIGGTAKSIFWSADVGLTHNFEPIPTGFLVLPDETGRVVQVT